MPTPKKEFYTAEWFPFYVERFEASDHVALMSLTEEGAYGRAIRMAWKTRTLPLDPEIFAARIGKRCTAKVAERVLKTFVVDPNDPKRVIHPVVEEIREEQYQKHLARVRGGKAAHVNAGNKGESSNGSGQQQLSSSSSPKEVEEDSSPKGEEGRQPPTKDIFIATILTGIAKNLGIQKFSSSVQREWIQEADIAYTNGFTAAEFVACHAEKSEKTRFTVKPEWINEGLPAFVKSRKKSKALPTPEQVKQGDAEHGATLRRAPGATA